MKNVTLVLRNKNIGGTNNLYDLYMKSKGKYIIVLESDDYWLSETKLQTQIDFLDNNLEYIGVSNKIRGIDINGNIKKDYPLWIKKDIDCELDDFLNNKYFSLSATMYRNIFLDLKKTVELNLSQGVPQSGAIIRNTEPYLYTYDAKNGWYVGSFVVDIPNIQQSYKVEFNYSEDPDYAIGGYAVLIYCLPEDKMVYPDFDCKENLPFVRKEN